MVPQNFWALINVNEMKQNDDTQVLFSIVNEAAVKLHFFKALSAIEQSPSLNGF